MQDRKKWKTGRYSNDSQVTLKAVLIREGLKKQSKLCSLTDIWTEIWKQISYKVQR